MKDKRLANVEKKIESIKKTINEIKHNLKKISAVISKQKPKRKRKSQTG